MTLRTHASASGRARGFSLVEIMIGVAIGMIGMLVIFRTVTTWDTHMRSTSSGGDAQSAGNLAMFNFERDIKQAGLGFMGIGDITITPPTSLGCGVDFTDTLTGRASINFSMVPVQIVPGALGAPDTITVLYGNSAFFVAQQKFTASSGGSKTLDRRNGFKRGDLAIVASGLSCQLIQVTDDSDPDLKTIAHASGNFSSFYAAPAASAAARYNTMTGPAFTLGDIYSLGPTPRRATWQVNTARAVLTSAEFFGGAAAFEVAEGVVNIKAEYGIDADGDRRVDTWTNVSPTTPAGWAQVLAVRVAMLVRSRQFEKSADQSTAAAPQGVTQVVPTWAGSGDPNAGFLMTNTDGTPDSFGPNDPDPRNWRFYRYRVYEKEILLRNVLWGTSPGSTTIIGG